MVDKVNYKLHNLTVIAIDTSQIGHCEDVTKDAGDQAFQCPIIQND